MIEQNWGIIPCDMAMDISPANGFTKLELDSAQKIQIGALLQQLPSMAATNQMPKLYTVTFPDGVSGKLMELKKKLNWLERQPQLLMMEKLKVPLL